MTRKLISLALASSFAWGQSMTPTIGLYLPAHGSYGWDTYYNANFSTIDLKVGEQASLSNFGAVGDASTDNAGAFAKASTWVNAGLNRHLYCSGGTYKYSSGLAFTSPATLMGFNDCVLNYTGNSHALDLGASGLTVSNPQLERYQVFGVKFTGGATATEGIYAYPYVTNILLESVSFFDFGNASAWCIFLQANNWYTLINNAILQSDPSFSGKWNGIRANGYTTGGATDSGNSRTIITNSLIQNFGATIAGTGVYLNAVQSVVQQSTVAGFGPSVQLGPWASDVLLDHFYTETPFNTPYAILAGDTVGPGAGNWLQGVTIQNCYFNVHNTDFSTATYPIGPVNASYGFNLWRVIGNTVASQTTGNPMVYQNNLGSQAGNMAFANMTIATGGVYSSLAGNVHTQGGSITPWSGTDGESVLFRNRTDNTEYITLQAGATANQYEGFLFNGYNGVNLGQFAMGSTGSFYLTVGTHTFTFSTAGWLGLDGSAGITQTTACTAGTHLSGITLVGGIVTALGVCN